MERQYLQILHDQNQKRFETLEASQTKQTEALATIIARTEHLPRLVERVEELEGWRRSIKGWLAGIGGASGLGLLGQLGQMAAKIFKV